MVFADPNFVDFSSHYPSGQRNYLKIWCYANIYGNYILHRTLFPTPMVTPSGTQLADCKSCSPGNHGNPHPRDATSGL